jgi:lariat debranching enzyme
LDTLKPKWWFSAHLHVKFKATVQHDGGATGDQENAATNEGMEQLVPSQVTQPAAVVTKSDAEGKVEAPDPAKSVPATTQFHSLESQKCAGGTPDLTDQMTQFLSLDKCLPRRQYLSILHVPATRDDGEKIRLGYDLEWLAILKKTHHLTVTERRRVSVPKELCRVTESEMESLRKKKLGDNNFLIPESFVQTVPPHQPNQDGRFLPPPLPIMGNPQTDALLDMLELDHVITVPYNPSAARAQGFAFHGNLPAVADDNEIDLDEEEEEEELVTTSSFQDDNEIDLEGDDGDDEGADEVLKQQDAAKKPRLDEFQGEVSS